MPLSLPRPAALVAAGALGVSLTTALEVLTAPYSPHVRAYAINGAVHALKVISALVLAAGLLVLARHLAARGERVAGAAAGGLAAATVLGAVPYSTAEALLDPSLTPAVAAAELDALHAGQPWIGPVASGALVLFVVSLVVLGGVALRHRLLPTWAPLIGFAVIPVAVLSGVLGEAGWPVPHPPAWIFLGLAAYGIALRRPSVPVPAAA